MVMPIAVLSDTENIYQPINQTRKICSQSTGVKAYAKSINDKTLENRLEHLNTNGEE